MVKTLAIVGSGVMGRAIAIACAKEGVSVRMIDIEKSALDRARSGISDVFATFQKLKLVRDGSELAENVEFCSEYKDGLRSAELAIESVPEDLELKKKVFVKIDELADASTILATNTSGLSITEIAAATGRPEKVVGIHFFAPAYILKAVEIVRGRRTSDGTVSYARAFVEQLRKVPVMVEKDTPNFVLNSIQFAMIKEARRLLEEGVVKSIEEVDAAIRDSFPVRQSVFGLFLDSDLISPYSSLTHPGRKDLWTNYRFEKSSDDLIRTRDEALLRLMKNLDEIRMVDLGKVEPAARSESGEK